MAIILDIVGNQYATRRLSGLKPQDMPRLVARLNFLSFPFLQRQANHENAAFADLAANRDVSAHQANELTADRQAEARASPRLLPGLGLLEVAEQLGLIVRRNARPCVFDFNAKKGFRRAPAVRTHAQSDAALLGKLDGIAQNVDEYLTQLVDVGHDVLRHVADDFYGER